ncbi:MAG: LysM peptidoglycan-binding domain-containing protein [Mycobacteriaceae bacterium]|nr:LysM peptidoglycan-binding domain-containing protein [Mycobacteriaceae bacterium]
MALIQPGAPGIATVCRPVRQSAWSRGGRRCRVPGPSRPRGASMRYRHIGVRMSVTPHARRPVPFVTTIALALLTGIVTAWLIVIAQVSAMTGGESAVSPARLAVVRVQPGETLQDLAARVAPDAPVQQVAGRIRELNKLETLMVVDGQTLIAPVG